MTSNGGFEAFDHSGTNILSYDKCPLCRENDKHDNNRVNRLIVKIVVQDEKDEKEGGRNRPGREQEKESAQRRANGFLPVPRGRKKEKKKNYDHVCQ